MELLIIAAGKGSRMGDIMMPKALVPILSVPNLENTITAIGNRFSKIIVAVSHSMLHHFVAFVKERNYKNVELLPISSGLGNGHATMIALKNILPNLRAKTSEPIVMCWGDVYFSDDQIIEELINEGKVYEHVKKPPSMVIPCAWEDEPYVSISVDDGLYAKGVTFSDIRRGLHDQSVFLMLNPALVYRQMNTMHNNIWNDGTYNTSTNDFSFLHIVPSCWNDGNPMKVYITENPLQAFNTMEELKLIEVTL